MTPQNKQKPHIINSNQKSTTRPAELKKERRRQRAQYPSGTKTTLQKIINRKILLNLTHTTWMTSTMSSLNTPKGLNLNRKNKRKKTSKKKKSNQKKKRRKSHRNNNNHKMKNSKKRTKMMKKEGQAMRGGMKKRQKKRKDSKKKKSKTNLRMASNTIMRNQPTSSKLRQLIPQL